ncbi:alanine racemase [Gaopeijia maritima]|uniref:Alanine racemase n=1 Tax=Gaopeijia maritima TaxID=3119007 RepID=A0ABU9EBD6_9BACT
MQSPLRTRAWIDVRAPALRRNFRRVAEAMGPDPWVLPMVKADAYGLGAPEVVRVLRAEGPAGWGVATVEEGVALRQGGASEPIVVFTPALPADFERVAAHDLEVAVSDPRLLDRLSAVGRACGRPVGVHLEVDTGMGRAGVRPEQLDALAGALRPLRESDGLRWVGMFTHLHSADEAGGPGVGAQLEGLRSAARALEPPPSVRVHAANSAGAFRLGAEAGGARPGIFLYGGRVGPDQPEPEAVVAVRARVVRVVDAAPGATLGYGATHRADGPERWATLAIGYGDGLPRVLGNRGEALIAGRRVPIIGRVSMDVTVVNISGVPGVEAGNAATLVGRDGGEELLLDEVAEAAGTISYEILTGLAPRLPRIWTEAE